MYSNMEADIFNAYMEKTDIDPSQFYAEVNQMTPQEYEAAQAENDTGMGSMQRAQESYMGMGQANEEKYFNQVPGQKQEAPGSNVPF